MDETPSALHSSSNKHDNQSATDTTSVSSHLSSVPCEKERALLDASTDNPADQFEWNDPCEEEQAVPDTSTGNPADQFEWNDCDVLIDSDTPESTTQGDTTPPENPSVDHPNPFVYDGARPANITKRKNIILFGETGVGKSSVINLMAGAEVASTSSNIEACTLEATEYAFTLPNPSPTSLRIYDTVGLNEPEMGVNTFLGAIEKAYQLIRSLHDAGGIDLLLFCIRGNRITTTVQRNFRLFVEFLCEKKVPLALVVTHLEYVDVMESWWKKNEERLGRYGIGSVAHACVTATPARLTMFAEKRAESRTALQEMFQDAFKLSCPDSPYVKDVRWWFANMVERLLSFLMKRMPASFRQRDLVKRLEARCELSRDEAQQLADMLAKDR